MLVAKEKPGSAYLNEQIFKGSNYSHRKNAEQPSPVRAKQYSLRGSLLFCGLILCLILISVGLVTQYGRVVAVNYELQQVQRDITQLKEDNEHLSIEVKALSSLERIEALAINELGLQYPEERRWLLLSSRGDEPRP